jgi:acyl-CoA hydrolase
LPTLSDSHVVSTEWVQPNDTNAIDIAHGGNVVKWMDEVGGLSAIRFSGEVCVTAAMRRVDFHHPIELGNAATLKAYVYKVGNTSIDVCIRVFGEDLLASSTKLTTQSYFTYVAIGQDRRPVEVPVLDIETDEEETKRQRALDDFEESEQRD